MRVVSALSGGKWNNDGPRSLMFEQNRSQSEIFESRSINKCPNVSLGGDIRRLLFD